MDHVGKRIIYFREQLGMAPVRLARMSLTSKSNLSKIEAGKSNPSALLLGRLAAALGVTPNDLLLDESPPSREEQIARVRGGKGSDPDPSLLRHRPGYAALTADPQARKRLGLSEAALEGIGQVPFPVELLPLRTARAAEVFLRFLEAVNAADDQ